MSAHVRGELSKRSAFIGDVMIERSPELHWEFCTRGKQHVYSQRAVVAGFPNIDPGYNVDPPT